MSAIVPNAALHPPGPSAARVAPVDPAQQRVGSGAAPGAGQATPGPSFADVLARETAPVAGAQSPTFSRHALERVNRRGIELDPATVQRLTGGISAAASKGSRDAVVFVDSTAFVVSVPNNTVITAVGSEHMRSHVFTNIDSAVIA